MSRVLERTGAGLILAIALTMPTSWSATEVGKPLLEEQYRFLLPDTCMSEQDREKVRGLLFEMLDAALKAHAQQVFETWMKNVSDQKQPTRARRGTRRGIAAYLRSREELQKWNPPQC